MAKRHAKIQGAVNAELAAEEAFSAELLRTLSAISASLGAVALRLAPARNKLRTDGDKAFYLRNLGLEPKAIAAILATTEKTVSTRLSEKAKADKLRSRRRRKSSANR